MKHPQNRAERLRLKEKVESKKETHKHSVRRWIKSLIKERETQDELRNINGDIA